MLYEAYGDQLCRYTYNVEKDGVDGWFYIFPVDPWEAGTAVCAVGEQSQRAAREAVG